MANKVLTIIFDTVEESLDKIIAAAVNEITAAGHKLKEIRLADDSGEVKIPPNTVEGVNPPEEAPVPETPVEAPPEDVPVDPTEVAAPSDATVPEPSSSSSS